jgi:SnoaL-like domain
MHRLSVLFLFCCSVVAACARPDADGFSQAERQALADSVLTLFDSLSAIHQGQPDTGILRRLHPPEDTLLFIEGNTVESFTGDSLFRRVLASHRPVRQMTQRFSQRRIQLLDADHAILTGQEDVEWVDTAGPHSFHGILTLVASRRGERWVLRGYRG